MNFYKGNSFSDIKPDDKNAVVSDDFIDFIYKSRSEIDFDVSLLYEIDPYNVILIPIENLNALITLCTKLQRSSIFEEYYAIEDVKITLEEIIEICSEALEDGVGIVSVGD